MSHIAVVPPAGRPIASGESNLGKNAPWADFFGLPRGGDLALQQQIDPYQRFPRETLHLPEVYRGHNPYLTQIMIDFISEEDLTPIRVILPLRETVNESSIVWDEYHFNNALLGPVPEEGVSRLVTQQISERQDHYVRGGLAFMIEHGFWQSEKGRQNYALQLTQIKNATLDGLYVGVLEALLMCKNVTNYYIQTLQHSISRNRLERSLKLEVEAWAEVQKTPNGWDMLNSRAHKALKLNGFVPDCWVVDEGTKRYIATVRPENSQYLLGGPEGKALYNSALPASSNPKLLDQRTGCLIFETKSFESPDARDPVNPMSRPRSIGEYNYSGPFQPVTRHAPYYSASRTIVVYDESRDGWAHISLLDGLNHCMRFEPKDGKEDDFRGHDGHKFYDDGPHLLPDLTPKNDMFMCNDTEDSKVASFIGDISDCIDCGGMEMNGLPDEAITDWANSVIYDLEPETEMALRDLKNLIYKIEHDFTPESQKYLEALVNAIKANGTTDSGLISFGDIQGQLQPPGKIMCWPHGFSSCAGLDYLAKEYHKDSESPFIKEAHDVASVGMKAFDRLYARLESACHDNCFFNDAAVPDYYKRKDGRYAFFSNLFHAALPAFVIKESGKGKQIVLTKNGSGSTSTLNLEKDPNANSIWKEGKDVYDRLIFTDLDEAFEHLFTQKKNNGEEIDSMTDKKDYESRKRSPDHIAIFNGLKKQIYDAANLAMQSEEGRDLIVKCMVQALFGVRFLKDVSFNLFCLFVDKLGKVRTFEQFHENFGKLLVATDAQIIKDHEKWVSEGLFTSDLTDGLEWYEEKTASPTTNVDLITALVASGDMMNTFKTVSGLQFTKDFTKAGAAVKRRYGYGYDVIDDGDQKKRFRGDAKLGLAAAFESLPVVIGSAAFAEIATMPGDAAGLSTASRFNFAEGADQQRVMTDDTFPRSGILSKPSKQFADRFNEINHEPEILVRVVKQALLGVPLTKRALEHFIKRDVVFPFNMLYFRPYMTYNMSSGVCLKSGAGTGETLVGQSDFQMGDDVQRKVHFGHYTIKYKSIVYNERAVYHAHDYMCTGYIGGNDTRFVTTQSVKNFSENPGEPEYFHSMYACLVPYQRAAYPNPIDITGNLYDKVSGEAEKRPKHYASADFYTKFWGWSNRHQVSSQEPMYTSERSAMNTVCFQGHQAMYSPSTQSYTQVIENSGHWGRNVYPGVGKVRAGLASAIQQVSYAEAYGGAAQQSHVTM